MNHTESCLFSMGRSEARQASRIVRWSFWVGATPPLKAKTGDAASPACPHHPHESILVRMLDVGISANQTPGEKKAFHISISLSQEGTKRGTHTGARRIAASHPPGATRMASVPRRRRAGGNGGRCISAMKSLFRL